MTWVELGLLGWVLIVMDTEEEEFVEIQDSVGGKF